jgi:hypothetical protein
MELTIEQALGNQWAMFYHSAIPVDDLTPVCTLQRVVDVVNNELQYNNRNLLSWSAMKQDEAARLMRANWIYQRLGTEPIRKPILVHQEQNQLVVDCGDTRLMALNLLPDPGTVSVVIVVPVAQAKEYADWRQIHTNRDLMRATGFGRGAGIALRTGATGAIEWLEIGDHTTAHHLHDVDQRVAMMQRYIDTQEDTFEFSIDWARSHINWDIYAR